MTAQYVPVLLTFAFAGTVAVTLLVLSRLLGRGRFHSDRKVESYESGMPLLDISRKRVSIRYFIVAMVFIVFDVEIAFLLPWAVAARGLLAEGSSIVLLEGLVFLLLLGVGYVYLWREGAFDWARRESS